MRASGVVTFDGGTGNLLEQDVGKIIARASRTKGATHPARLLPVPKQLDGHEPDSFPCSSHEKFIQIVLGSNYSHKLRTILTTV